MKSLEIELVKFLERQHSIGVQSPKRYIYIAHNFNHLFFGSTQFQSFIFWEHTISIIYFLGTHNFNHLFFGNTQFQSFIFWKHSFNHFFFGIFGFRIFVFRNPCKLDFSHFWYFCLGGHWRINSFEEKSESNKSISLYGVDEMTSAEFREREQLKGKNFELQLQCSKNLP